MPVAGEPFVFTEFSGEPQCFLTEAQLDAELLRVGFVRDPGVPLHEYNLPKPGLLSTGKMPVILRGIFPPRLTYSPNVTTSPRADVAWRTGPSTCLFWRRGW